MNRFRKDLIKFLTAHFLVYVLFTQLAMPGLVLCLGPDGHVAVEMESANTHHHSLPDTLSFSLLLDNQPHDWNESAECVDISLDHESGLANTNQKKQSDLHANRLILSSGIMPKKNYTDNTERHSIQNISLSTESIEVLFTTVLLI